MAGGIEQAVERALRQTAACGIVHQQGVIGLDELLIEQMGDAVGDALGAGVATLRMDAGVFRQRDAIGKPCIAGRDDDGDVGYAGVGGE